MAGLVVVGLALAGVGVLRPRGQADLTRAEAVRVASNWVQANVPRGSTVGFGQMLGYEVAVTLLQRDYRAVKIAENQSLGINSAAPLGVREVGKPAADDWIALSAAPRPRLDPLRLSIRPAPGIDPRPRGARLGPERAERQRQSDHDRRRATGGKRGRATAGWSGPLGSGHLKTTIFTIDPDRLGFGRPVVVGVDALDQIVRALEKEPSPGRSPRPRCSSGYHPARRRLGQGLARATAQGRGDPANGRCRGRRAADPLGRERR